MLQLYPPGDAIVTLYYRVLCYRYAFTCTMTTKCKGVLCVPAISEPTCTWSGQLPVKIHRNPAYSCKVFLGGVPWDITEGMYEMSLELAVERNTKLIG